MTGLRPIPWRVERLEDCWMGVCDPLKLTVESGTRDELVEDIIDVLETAIQSWSKSGDLDQVLQGSGLPVPERGNHPINFPFLPVLIANADFTAEAGS